MENINKRTWKIIQRIATFLFTVFVIVFVIRFAVYFMPFLIAGIIAIIIEPIIKFCMNKLKMSRRVSSIIIVSITIILICLAAYYGGSIAIKETIKLTKNITPAISTVMDTTKQLINNFKQENSSISPEVISAMESSIMEFVGNVGSWVVNWVTGLTKYIFSIPYMIINIVITILALIFFTKDRIYVIDLAEHHLPKKWVKKISQVTSEFFHTLGRIC
ncbi:MAG: AI-2E family transporter [Clostridia bacterium]|nr:AI-2E family transporter [Clostridia bacterium]